MNVRWTHSAMAHLVAVHEHIVIYEVADRDVRVLAVIHGARLLPPRSSVVDHVEPSDPAGSP